MFLSDITGEIHYTFGSLDPRYMITVSHRNRIVSSVFGTTFAGQNMSGTIFRDDSNVFFLLYTLESSPDVLRIGMIPHKVKNLKALSDACREPVTDVNYVIKMLEFL